MSQPAPAPLVPIGAFCPPAAIAAAFLPQRERLRQLLAERAYARREVTLSSGRKSNFYIDCKQVSLHAEGSFLCGQLVRAVIDVVAPNAACVGGLTIGADPLATATSVMSFLASRPLHAFYVRKEAKGHGTGAWLEGMSNLPPTTAAVIVEDVVTTGASTLRAVERARQAELDVVHVVALVDRDEGGRQAIEQHVPLTALFVRSDFTSEPDE